MPARCGAQHSAQSGSRFLAQIAYCPHAHVALALTAAMQGDASQLLRLLHIADSALPVGATAHSFGLETLVQDRDVDLPQLERWFGDYLLEAGTVDAHYCRRAHEIGLQMDEGAPGAWLGSWCAANQELGALRPARESRAASHALGGRMLRLLADLQPHPAWQAVLRAGEAETHYCCVFGLGGALLGLDADVTALALLRQNVAGLVSACQRLMPLGQGRAGQLLWKLQAAIVAAASSAPAVSAAGPEIPFTFTALLDVGSMRHPQRSVRLFIS
jgi:urease accessory protein